MARQHPWDKLPTDLAEWVENTATKLAATVTSGGPAPFGANLTEAQELAYYEAQLFGPDGSINNEGRAALMARVGPVGYADVFRAVATDRARRGGSIATAPRDLMNGGTA